MTGPLDRRVYAEVARLCAEGRRQLHRSEVSEALATFLEAWELLSDPWEEGEAAACVLSGLADVLMARGDVAAAATALRAVERALGATGSHAAAP
jgi:ATP/maltotriose-dependent transcriptional regulator MalT